MAPVLAQQPPGFIAVARPGARDHVERLSVRQRRQGHIELAVDLRGPRFFNVVVEVRDQLGGDRQRLLRC
eukprot:7673037-Lingulodinium_polyedra.AAC.1